MLDDDFAWFTFRCSVDGYLVRIEETHGRRWKMELSREGARFQVEASSRVELLQRCSDKISAQPGLDQAPHLAAAALLLRERMRISKQPLVCSSDLIFRLLQAWPCSAPKALFDHLEARVLGGWINQLPRPSRFRMVDLKTLSTPDGFLRYLHRLQEALMEAEVVGPIEFEQAVKVWLVRFP